MKESKEKLPALEEGLLSALKALDNQIAREMQRDQKQRDEHGAQKWAPYQSRIERLCSFLLNALGDNDVELDGLIVLAQTFSKTLSLVAEDLRADGLGKLRAQYMLDTFEHLERDAENVRRHLANEPLLS